MRVRGFTAAGIAAAATVVFCGSPAFAGQDAMVHTTDHVKDYGGKALFNDRGDAFTVCDLKADGMTAEAIVKIGDADGTTAYLSDLDGAGTCKHFTRNMPENHSFKMRVCLQKNYRGEYHCSNWAWGVA